MQRSQNMAPNNTTTATTPKSTTAVRGASLLIILQIVSRAITFVANQLLLRFLTAELLGVSTQLEVFYLSVLFFSRESLRVAVLRTDAPAASSEKKDGRKPETEGRKGHGDEDGDNSHHDDDDGVKASDKKSNGNKSQVTSSTTQAAVNLSYLSLLIGIPLTFLLGYTYLRSLPANILQTTPNLVPSLYIYAVSALIELASEPAFIVLAIRLRFATRGRAESLGTFARCGITLGTAFWASKRGMDLGVLPFALGQLGFGIVVAVVYGLDALREANSEGFSLSPRTLSGERRHAQATFAKAGKEQIDGGDMNEAMKNEFILGLFSRPTLNLARSMVVQSGVKYVLTQGDTLLVSVLSTPEAVGVYALVNNYGGLLARLVFQPVEESSRSYFSRLLSGSLSQTTATERGTDDEATKEKEHEEKDQKSTQTPKQQQEDESPLQTAQTSLNSLIHLYLLFSLPIISLGPSAASPLLSLIAGSRWAADPSASGSSGGGGAGKALAAYTLYIPLLALNGVTEAFVSSVASEEEVHAQSAFMVLCTAAFGFTGWLGLRVLGLGARGLVLANAVNMGARIAWSAWFIRGWFGKRGVKQREGGGMSMMPVQLATGSAAVVAGVVRTVVVEGEGVVISLVKVAGCAVPFAGVL